MTAEGGQERVKGELQERIARALAVWFSSDDDDRHWERHTGAAGIALVALGLDDLDAAVERLATFMSATEPYRHFHPENLKGHARRALEAALTPPVRVTGSSGIVTHIGGIPFPAAPGLYRLFDKEQDTGATVEFDGIGTYTLSGVIDLMGEHEYRFVLAAPGAENSRKKGTR